MSEISLLPIGHLRKVGRAPVERNPTHGCALLVGLADVIVIGAVDLARAEIVIDVE